MKNLIYIILMILTPMFMFAQNSSLKVISNGNVGIGTDTPTQKLEVDGFAKAKTFILQNTLSASASCERIDYSAFAFGAGINAGFTVDENFNLEFRSNTRTKVLNRQITSGKLLLRFQKNTGFAGFGIDPSEAVHVRGNVQTTGIFIDSDKRLKQNAKDFKYGLKEVMKLQPMTYDYTGKGGTISGRYNIGLFAQDLQKIAPELVSEYTHVEENQEGEIVSEKEYLKIYDTGIKYILVNAIQEQQEIIKTQDEKIATLEDRLVKIETLLSSQDTDINQQSIQLDGRGAYLEQNQPNPFNSNTLIRYNVPADVKDAIVNVFDVNGQLIHSEVITRKGLGEVQLKSGTVAAGTYSYSLVIDGQVIDTKRMVIVK